MAVFNGTDFKASVVGTPNKPIANLRDLSITINNEELDITTKDSGGWKRTMAGVRSWSASATFVLDWQPGLTKVGAADALELQIERDEIELIFGTLTTGDKSFTGKGLLMDISFSTPYEGVCEGTLEISGNGPIVMATIA